MRWESREFRELVCQLECMHCGAHNRTQPAHRNEGKGMGLKTTDAYVAALCDSCHRELDQGKTLEREERRQMWVDAYLKTIKALIERGMLVVKKRR